MCCKTRLLLAIGFGGEFWPCPCPALPMREYGLNASVPNLTPRLREANGGHRWRRTAEKLSKPPQVLCSCGEQHFILGAAQATQPKPVELQNALHMSKPHLALLPLAPEVLKGFRVGKRADAITHLLIDIAGDLAHGRRRAPRLQGAGRAVMFVGSVVDNVALIDVAGAGKLCTARTNIDVTFLVEDEVGPA